MRPGGQGPHLSAGQPAPPLVDPLPLDGADGASSSTTRALPHWFWPLVKRMIAQRWVTLLVVLLCVAFPRLEWQCFSWRRGNPQVDFATGAISFPAPSHRVVARISAFDDACHLGFNFPGRLFGVLSGECDFGAALLFLPQSLNLWQRRLRLCRRLEGLLPRPGPPLGCPSASLLWLPRSFDALLGPVVWVEFFCTSQPVSSSAMPFSGFWCARQLLRLIIPDTAQVRHWM